MFFETMFATFVKLCLQHLWRKMFVRQKKKIIKFIQKYSLVLCMGVEWVKKTITNLTSLFKTIIKEKKKMLCRKK